LRCTYDKEKHDMRRLKRKPTARSPVAGTVDAVKPLHGQ
jgi:hypothetical protein